MSAASQKDAIDVLAELGYACFEMDLCGNLTRGNAPFYSSVGYSQQELAGRHYRRFSNTRQIRKIHETLDAARQTGLPQQGVEYILRKQNGALIYAEGVIAPMVDASGQASGYRVVLHDITERKKVEAALQQARQSAERDLVIGRQIQASFLPRSLPQPSGWEVASLFEAAREVAGDFYDGFSLSGGKRIGLVVADVCDKGVGAALFMALFRSLIRAFADQHYSLGWMDVLSGERGAGLSGDAVGRRRELLSTGATALQNAIDLTNNYIANNHGDTNMFATVFFGLLDPARGQLIYINGGHEPPFLLGPQGEIKARLEPTGPAVGLMPGLEFRIRQVELKPGDTLLAYTDGVIDSRSPSGDSFGEERLAELLQAPVSSAQGLLERLHTRLREHVAGTAPYDDVTLLAVTRKSGLSEP